MTVFLTAVLLPFASLLYGAALALRDGGAPVWEWVRILVVVALFLTLIIVFPDAAPVAEVVAVAMIVLFHVTGFYAWRLFGTGISADEKGDAKDGRR